MTSSNLQKYTIAIAGQPNTGKSTVFNLLTGLNQQVGNWAGKTIEKSMGRAPDSEGGYAVVDLPGTYSLNACSEEERIAATFITESQADLVVIVANAASAERTLYYALDVMLLGNPCIIVLNMMDVAEANGKKPDIQALEKALGIPVIPLIASKGSGAQGSDVLHQFSALRACIRQRLEKPVAMHDITRQLEAFLSKDTQKHFQACATSLHQHSKQQISEEKARSIAWQALENKAEAVRIVTEYAPALVISQDTFFEDTQQARYTWLEHTTGNTSSVSATTISYTRRWDAWLLHPFWGTIAMVFILLATTLVGFSLGFFIGMEIRGLLHPLEAIFASVIPADFPAMQGMTKGVFRGMSAVFTMLPLVFTFYTMFAVLEDIGYMNRAALLMDRLMRKIGLNGKAFVPLLFALPCNIAGATACRTIENQRTKKLVLLLIPLMPCAAKLVVLFTFATWIFPGTFGALIVLAIFMFNMLILLSICKLFGLFIAKEKDIGMVMELPHYHRPNFRTIAHSTITQCKNFLGKAATLIVSCTIILWFLSYYPTGNIETSWLGQFGQFIEPIGHLMGIDWRLLTALLASIISRELMLATIGITYNVPLAELPEILQATLTPAAAIAFMCAQILFFPCLLTLGMLYKESRSAWLTGGIFLYTLILPFIVSPLVFILCSAFL